MRTFGVITAALAALASTVAAMPSTSNAGLTFAARDGDSLNSFEECKETSELDCGFVTAPTPTEPAEESSEAPEEDLNNAQRLARGLPLKAPTRRDATRVHLARHSQGPTTTLRGFLRVDRSDGTGTLGYISKNTFSGAQYRYQTRNEALVVHFDIPEGSTSPVDNLNIETENSDIQKTFPRLALVQGRDNVNSDLTTGSFQYAYIAGSDATAPGATPQGVPNSYTASTGLSRTAESAVWRYDPKDNKVYAHWTNGDENMAQSEMFVQSTAMYVGGDLSAFKARYPSPTIPVELTFVPFGV